MFERSCFKTPFQSKRVHVSQTLLKSARQDFYCNFPLKKDKLTQKRSVSVRSEISVLFVDTSNAGHRYSCNNCESFVQYLQRPLTQKQETFSGIFIIFLDSIQNFADFQKKGQVHSLIICEVIESQKCVDVNARKLLFNNTLPESMCSRVPDTVEICTVGLLS